MKLKHIPVIALTALGACQDNDNNSGFNYPEGLGVESVISCDKGDKEILHIGQIHDIGINTLYSGEKTKQEISKSQNSIYNIVTEGLKKGNPNPLVISTEGLTETPTIQEVKDIFTGVVYEISQISYAQIESNFTIKEIKLSSKKIQNATDLFVLSDRCMGKTYEECMKILVEEGEIDMLKQFLNPGEVLTKDRVLLYFDIIDENYNKKKQEVEIEKTRELDKMMEESIPLVGGAIRCAEDEQCTLLYSESLTIRNKLDKEEALLTSIYQNLLRKIVGNDRLSDEIIEDCAISLMTQVKEKKYDEPLDIAIQNQCSLGIEKEIKELEESHTRIRNLVIKEREDYAVKSINDNWDNFESQGYAPLIYGEAHDFTDNIEDWNQANPKDSFCLSRVY